MRIAYLAAGLALLLFAGKVHAQNASVGTVTGVQGAATVTQGAGVSRPLNIGDEIFNDDLLETAAGAKLLVTFSDATKLTLGPSAEVVVDEFVYNPNGGTNNAVMRVTAGAMRLVAGAIETAGGPQAVTVTTPVATIGIRGTDFFVEQDAEHLSVALFSGYRVAVTNPTGQTLLRPGEGTDIWGTGAPTQALTWGSERINRALSLVTLARTTERTLPYAQPLASADDVGAALVQGKFRLEARYRYEFVDRASQPLTASASTLRLRLSYETQAWNGLFAGVGGEVTTNVGDARHSDGVRNTPSVPVIADPESEVLNLAYLGWTKANADGLAQARAVIGRQRLAYESERWVGPGAFRQNDQTFDAATIEARLTPNFTLRYAYLDRINRILGNNPGGHWKSDSHLIAATTDLVPYGWTTAYAYLLDLRPVPLLSSATYGLRYDGLMRARDDLSFGLEAEFARQTDHAANPLDYAVTYALLRPSVKFGDVTGTTLAVGWERLGGNGVAALQTPLATLHRHNGWADVFTNTPINGLDDLHVRVMQELPDAGFLKKPKIDLRYHFFEAARGGLKYGREFDADANASLLGWATIGMRFARYEARGFDADATKLWFYVEFQY
jgi:hypothetical protein